MRRSTMTSTRDSHALRNSPYVLIIRPFFSNWTFRVFDAFAKRDGVARITNSEPPAARSRSARLISARYRSNAGRSPFGLLSGDESRGSSREPVARRGRALLFGITCRSFRTPPPQPWILRCGWSCPPAAMSADRTPFPSFFLGLTSCHYASSTIGCLARITRRVRFRGLMNEWVNSNRF